MDGTVTPSSQDILDSPPMRGREGSTKSEHTSTLRTPRGCRSDRKKTGTGLRGKNVTEAFRVKEKDLKRTMK